jgi:hypothetical protein
MIISSYEEDFSPTPSSTPDDAGGPLRGFNGGIAVLGVKEPVELRRAGFHQFRHVLLGQPLLLHLVGKLAREYRLDGGQTLDNY